MNSQRNDKTVYVLGAGFSMPAGGPSQASLLGEIIKLPESLPKVRANKKRLVDFLTQTLCFSKEQLGSVPLEDIYTPIDRCLADGVALRGVPLEQIQTIRSELEYLISLAIDQSFKRAGPGAKEYVKRFAAHLVRQAQQRAQPAHVHDKTAAALCDPFSIISLNWDVLLDNELYDELELLDRFEHRDYAPIGVVDYCCYVSSIEKWQKRIRPGLWALGSRGYNVKLLKIHGSMNWLQCSNCQRLFVGFGQKMNIPIHINDKLCRHCKTHDHTAKLQGALVMPTFLKDLTNFQIKLVWQNAGVELMEASRLVFIGYSLPYADFEFRQLLSRMVHKNAHIHVVLFKGQNSATRRKFNEECQRYKEFFGERNVTFECNGAEAYVNSLGVIPGHKLPS